jgi:hypothetical protein
LKPAFTFVLVFMGVLLSAPRVKTASLLTRYTASAVSPTTGASLAGVALDATLALQTKGVSDGRRLGLA